MSELVDKYEGYTFKPSDENDNSNLDSQLNEMLGKFPSSPEAQAVEEDMVIEGGPSEVPGIELFTAPSDKGEPDIRSVTVADPKTGLPTATEEMDVSPRGEDVSVPRSVIPTDKREVPRDVREVKKFLPQELRKLPFSRRALLSVREALADQPEARVESVFDVVPQFIKDTFSALGEGIANAAEIIPTATGASFYVPIVGQTALRTETGTPLATIKGLFQYGEDYVKSKLIMNEAAQNSKTDIEQIIRDLQSSEDMNDSEKEQLSEILREIDVLEGENLFYGLGRYMFKDATRPIEAFEDISKASSIFTTVLIGNSILNATSDIFTPIRAYLDIPPERDNAFYRGLSFGGSTLGAASVPVGLINIFRKGVITNVSKAAGRSVLKHTEGLPFMREGGKIYGVLKPFMKEKGVSPKVPFSKIVPKDLLKLEYQMGVGSAVGFSASDYFFHGTEYQNLNYLFGFTGGMLAPGKLGKVPGRVMNGILYGFSRAGYKTAEATGFYAPSPERFAGATNAFMRSIGYSSKKLKEIDKRTDDDLRQLFEDNTTEEAIRKAKQKGLMLENGETNYDLYKLPLINTGTTAADIQYYSDLARTISNMPDGPMKADFQASAERSKYLLQKLAKDIKGPDQVEKLQALTATFSDLITLATVRNYQAQLLNRIELGPFGNFRGGKGGIVADIEAHQRQIDIRVDSIKEQLENLRLNTDAEQSTKIIFNRIDDYIADTARARTDVSNTLRRRLVSFAHKVKQKYVKRTEKEIRERDELLQIGDSVVVRGTPKGDEYRFNSEQAIFGKKGEVSKYGPKVREFTERGEEIVKNSTFIRNGVLTDRIEESGRRYEAFYTEADEANLLINANPLDDSFQELLNDPSVFVSVRKAVGAVSPQQQMLTGSYVKDLKRRGLSEFRKKYEDSDGNLIDEYKYKDKLMNIADENDILFDINGSDGNPLSDSQLIRSLENLFIRHDKRIEGVTDMLMTMREWNMFRSELLKRERQAWKASDFGKFNSYKGAVNNFDNLLESSKVPESILSKLDDAKTHYNTKVVPYRKYLATAWKDDNSALSDPSNYFLAFFTRGGNDSAEANRRLFDELFAEPLRKKDVEKGILTPLRDVKTYPEDVKKLLTQAAGIAWSKGVLEPNDINVWKGVLDKNVIKGWNEVARLKQIGMYIGTKGDIPDEVPKHIKDKIALIQKSIDGLDDVTANNLKASLFGVMSGTMGRERFGAGEADIIYANAFGKGGTDMSSRSDIVDVLMSGSKMNLERRFGIAQEDAERIVKQQFGGEARPLGTTSVADNPLLPPIVRDNNEILKNPLEIIMASPLGQNKEFVEAIRDVVTNEILYRSIKFNSDLKTLGTAERAAAIQKNLRNPFKFVPVIELGTDFDLVAMRTFMEDNQKNLSILFSTDAAGRKHLDDLNSLLESMIMIKGATPSIPMRGMVSGYSLNMGLGRAYNVMKGVVSARYALLEGGIITARQKQTELMLKMFKDPAAAEIVHDIFVLNKRDPSLMKRFAVEVFGEVGLSLTKNEYSVLNELTEAVTDFAVGVTQSDEYQRINREILERDKRRQQRAKTSSNQVGTTGTSLSGRMLRQQRERMLQNQKAPQ